jgi:hypothetical protein
MYYVAMGEGLIDKDAQGKRNNYMRVRRRLLQMRRDGRMPYSWITDSSRTIYGYNRFADEDDFSTYAANIYRKDNGSNLLSGSRFGSRRTRWRESLCPWSATSTA